MVGGTSAAQIVTLTNTGALALPITSVSAGTQFAVTHDCGASVAVGATCTLTVVFRPTSGGAKTGSLSVTGGNGAGSRTVSLSGTAIVPTFSLAPGSLAFGEQAVGGTSAAQAVTLSNTGTLTLPITSVGMSGQFAVTHDCGTSVAVGATCTLNVVFRPTSVGAKSGTLSVTGGNGAGSRSVTLGGTAT